MSRANPQRPFPRHIIRLSEMAVKRDRRKTQRSKCGGAIPWFIDSGKGKAPHMASARAACVCIGGGRKGVLGCIAALFWCSHASCVAGFAAADARSVIHAAAAGPLLVCAGVTEI